MKKQNRISHNLDVRINPFAQAGEAAPLEWNLPDMEAPADLRHNWYKSDRPTPADAAFARKNPFIAGMEKAAGVGETVFKFKDFNREKDYFETVGELTMEDFKSTNRYAKPASLTKKARPTQADAIDAKRKQAINDQSYYTPEQQVKWDVRHEITKRRDMAASKQPLKPTPQDAYRKGFDMAKQVKSISDHMRKKFGKK